MLSFQEYRKQNCKGFLNTKRAKEMYSMYVKGEEEIMGQSLTMKDICMAKEALVKACVPMQFVSNSVNMTPAQFYGLECCNEQEGTTPMNTNTERDYLNRRVSNVFSTLDRSLEKQFHLGENTYPKTYKELIDWIKNDKYELDKHQTKIIDACVEENGQFYGAFYEGIIWTGCGFKVDRKGYDTAREVLCKEYQAVKDVINVSDAAAGLKALQEFEAWTYEVEAAPTKKSKH
jgi:hypothetical protein